LLFTSGSGPGSGIEVWGLIWFGISNNEEAGGFNSNARGLCRHGFGRAGIRIDLSSPRAQKLLLSTAVVPPERALAQRPTSPCAEKVCFFVKVFFGCLWDSAQEDLRKTRPMSLFQQDFGCFASGSLGERSFEGSDQPQGRVFWRISDIFQTGPVFRLKPCRGSPPVFACEAPFVGGVFAMKPREIAFLAFVADLWRPPEAVPFGFRWLTNGIRFFGCAGACFTRRPRVKPQAVSFLRLLGFPGLGRFGPSSKERSLGGPSRFGNTSLPFSQSLRRPGGSFSRGSGAVSSVFPLPLCSKIQRVRRLCLDALLSWRWLGIPDGRRVWVSPPC